MGYEIVLLFIGRYRRFEGTYCLDLQANVFLRNVSSPTNLTTS
jgi:hypothetical protein